MDVSVTVLFFLKEKEEGEKGEGEGGRGGEDGGKKEEEKGAERASILVSPEGTPAPHLGAPLILPHSHQRCSQWREGVQPNPVLPPPPFPLPGAP